MSSWFICSGFVSMTGRNVVTIVCICNVWLVAEFLMHARICWDIWASLFCGFSHMLWFEFWRIAVGPKSFSIWTAFSVVVLEITCSFEMDSSHCFVLILMFQTGIWRYGHQRVSFDILRTFRERYNQGTWPINLLSYVFRCITHTDPQSYLLRHLVCFST